MTEIPIKFDITRHNVKATQTSAPLVSKYNTHQRLSHQIDYQPCTWVICKASMLTVTRTLFRHQISRIAMKQSESAKLFDLSHLQLNASCGGHVQRWFLACPHHGYQQQSRVLSQHQRSRNSKPCGHLCKCSTDPIHHRHKRTHSHGHSSTLRSPLRRNLRRSLRHTVSPQAFRRGSLDHHQK